MDELSCRHLFSLCHRRGGEGGKKGRSWKDKRGGERRGWKKKKARRLSKFLSGCYCPWRVFKAGKGSLHKKMAFRMLTVTLHSLWGRHRHLNALGDSCNHFISDIRRSAAQHKGSEMISECDLVELNLLTPQCFYIWLWNIYHTYITAVEDNYFPPGVDLSDLFYNNFISIGSKTMREPKMLFYLSKGFWQFYSL